MNKALLLAAATMLAAMASAQTRLSDAPKHHDRVMDNHIEVPVGDEMACEATATISHRPALRAPQRVEGLEVGYYRPAGAWYADQKVVDGAYTAYSYAPFLVLTPHEDYTFHGFATGVSDAATYAWRYQLFVNSNRPWFEASGQDLTVSYRLEIDSVPQLTVTDGARDTTYYLSGSRVVGTADNPVVTGHYASWIAAIHNFQAVKGYNYVQSSHYFGAGGRRGTNRYLMTYLSGATPWGSNSKGWWYGKNAGQANGVAAVFERPSHPYQLKHVDILVRDLAVTQEVELQCKVYRIEGPQPYADSASVYRDAVPGELVATGRCVVDANTSEATGGMLEFVLYTLDDDLEVEVMPTVDYPIMITFEDYNDSPYDALTDFTLMASTETADEGFGEQAYVKVPATDADGNPTGEYIWQGVNHLFAEGELKTGLTIFIDADHNYLAYNYPQEDGQYTFPNEGGVMEKQFVVDDVTFTTTSIEFYTSVPSQGGEWAITCDGGDLPAWLHIELADGEADRQGNRVVTALVTADALPATVGYRQATVQFAVPGNYKHYHFAQGSPETHVTGDVNGDGVVTIADINAVIDAMLRDTTTDQAADVNADGNITIADINAIIAILLTEE